MTLRKIEWEDLLISIGWRNRRGDVRVYVSLKGCSFINKLFWLDWKDTPEQRTMVLACMRKAAMSIFGRIKPYINTQEQGDLTQLLSKLECFLPEPGGGAFYAEVFSDGGIRIVFHFSGVEVGYIEGKNLILDNITINNSNPEWMEDMEKVQNLVEIFLRTQE
jgi:hypothetical protein